MKVVKKVIRSLRDFARKYLPEAFERGEFEPPEWNGLWKFKKDNRAG